MTSCDLEPPDMDESEDDDEQMVDIYSDNMLDNAIIQIEVNKLDETSSPNSSVKQHYIDFNDLHLHEDESKYFFGLFTHLGANKEERKACRARRMRQQILQAELSFDKATRPSRMEKKRRKYLMSRLRSTPSLTSIKEDENEDLESINEEDDDFYYEEEEEEMNEILHLSQIDLTLGNSEKDIPDEFKIDTPKRPHSVNLPPLNCSTSCLQWKQAMLAAEKLKMRTLFRLSTLSGRNSFSTPFLPIRSPLPYVPAPLELTHPIACRKKRRDETSSPSPPPIAKPIAIKPGQEGSTKSKPVKVFKEKINVRKPWRSKVIKLVTELLNKRLESETYQPKNCASTAQELAAKLIEIVKEATSESYKVVSLVSIGSITQENSMLFTSRAYWDQNNDKLLMLRYKNVSLYCTVLIYAFSIQNLTRRSVEQN